MHESAWSNVISSWRMGWSGFLSCVEHFKFSLKTKSPLQVALNQNCRFIMGEGIFFRGKWIIFRQSRPFLSESLKGEEKNVFLLEKDIKPVKQAQSGFPGWDGWMDGCCRLGASAWRQTCSVKLRSRNRDQHNSLCYQETVRPYPEPKQRCSSLVMSIRQFPLT